MRKNHPLIAVVLLLGGGFVVFGILTGDFPRVVRNYFSASVSINDSADNAGSDDLAEKIYDSKYSFSEDDDKDGLSNAKEVIYGTDPQKQDSDGDGHLDEDEVKNGYDPARAGNISIENRFEENLTIRYFSWAQKRTANEDPRLETKLVNEFIAKEVDTSLPHIDIPDSDITMAENDEYDTVLTYFRETGSVPLPTVASSYLDIAEEAVLGNLENIDKTLNQLSTINGQLRSIQTPPVAVSLQKKYIQLVSILKILFGDLYLAKVDPVKLSANLERGKKLIELIGEIATETKSIVDRYQIQEPVPEAQ